MIFIYLHTVMLNYAHGCAVFYLVGALFSHVFESVEEAGIPRQYLNILVKENKLERVAHGVYLTPVTFDDEMYRLQAKNQRAIFSHETALYLHDLTDRDPIEWSVTVPYGYNATHLRNEGVKVCTVKKPLYQMGVTELRTI